MHNLDKMNGWRGCGREPAGESPPHPWAHPTRSGMGVRVRVRALLEHVSTPRPSSSVARIEDLRRRRKSSTPHVRGPA